MPVMLCCIATWLGKCKKLKQALSIFNANQSAAVDYAPIITPPPTTNPVAASTTTVYSSKAYCSLVKFRT